MNPELVLLHLSLIPDVGPVTIAKIVEKKDSIDELSTLYVLSSSDLQDLFRITPAAAQKIAVGLTDTKALEQELLLLERHAVHWTSIIAPDYPPLLSAIHAPPTIFYWQGARIDPERLLFAMVGSRAANQYARSVINTLVPELVAKGLGIVSGGAIGADTMVHQATLDAGGTTIAVLGSGLLMRYPRINNRLFDAIIERGGTLMSTFPVKMGPLPAHFPARNRIIAGLSRGCLVVQAAKESGASITAKLALDQGRDVFAIPGPIDDPLSAGCHSLIRQGATLVTSVADIITELTGQTYHVEQRRTLEDAAALLDEASDASPEIVNNPHMRVRGLCRRPCTVDTLLQQTGWSLSYLSQILFDLQLEGAIEQHSVGTWQSL